MLGVWAAILHVTSEVLVALSVWFDPTKDWIIFAFVVSTSLSMYINHVLPLKQLDKQIQHVIIVGDLCHYPLFFSLLSATLLRDRRYWVWTLAAFIHHSYDLLSYISILYKKPHLFSQKWLLFGNFAMTIFVWLGVNGSSYL